MDNELMNENIGEKSPEKKNKKKELRTILIVAFVTTSCFFASVFLCITF